MHKGAVKLLALLAIVAVAYSLDLKPNLLPTIVDSAHKVYSLSREEGSLAKLETGIDQGNLYGRLELELSKHFKERSEQFSVSFNGDKTELSDNMAAIIRAALKHDDYTAYVLESYMYTIRSWGNKSTITVEARYRESIEESAEVDRAADKALAEMLKPGMNDHEKVKAIHDWIVKAVDYDQSLSYYTAYNAISLGKAVCQGYSLLGHRMLEKAGIPVLIAEGTVQTGEHAWNMVQLDGQWYHMDLTWDDPVGVKDDRIRYSYYLKTDEELRADHSWTGAYPKASVRYADALHKLGEQSGAIDKLRFNKLKQSLGLHWLDPEHTVTDGKRLREIIQSAIKSRTTHLAFRYVRGAAFPDELKAAFEGIRVAVGYRASYEKFGSDNSVLVNIYLNFP